MPEPAEAAARLGWTVDQVQSVDAARHVTVSLNQPVNGTTTELGALLAAEIPPPEDALDGDAISRCCATSTRANGA